MVLDINLVHPGELAKVSVSWQLQRHRSWKLPLYFVSDEGIKRRIVLNKNCHSLSFAVHPPTGLVSCLEAIPGDLDLVSRCRHLQMGTHTLKEKSFIVIVSQILKLPGCSLTSV